MSLNSSVSLLQDPTSFTIVGGTATTFVNDGTGINGKKVLVDSSQSDPSLRKKLITQITVGAVSANGGTAKLHRNNVTMHQPFKDAAGVVYPLADGYSLSFHPAQTAAERAAKVKNFFAAALDAELDNLKNMIND